MSFWPLCPCCGPLWQCVLTGTRKCLDVNPLTPSPVHWRQREDRPHNLTDWTTLTSWQPCELHRLRLLNTSYCLYSWLLFWILGENQVFFFYICFVFALVWGDFGGQGPIPVAFLNHSSLVFVAESQVNPLFTDQPDCRALKSFLSSPPQCAGMKGVLCLHFYVDAANSRQAHQISSFFERVYFVD